MTRYLFVCCVSAIILGGCRGDTSIGNKLASASSPYLRDHADNPVHWVEWSDDALNRAKEENKPIIVSIGYASCHWCHVMERETFMDTAVARIMNTNFVCIKVDREERPDLDQVYIRAAEMISGNAGWPLNAFALPDGRPFYAATYFPNEQWKKMIEQVSFVYQTKYEEVKKTATDIQNSIASEDNQLFAADSQDTSRIDSFLSTVPAWTIYLDIEHGGLSGTNRFPMPVIGEFYLQHHYLTGDELSLLWVRRTLDEMAYGGIYDQLAGGFSRYTTDSLWHIPHFEKMLYDNGLLVSLYSHAYQLTKDPLYLDIVNETLNFVRTELTSSEGAFYSSINAESEGEEGRFYVWTYDEIESLLSDTLASKFIETYGIKREGNWEAGKNVLSIAKEKRNMATRAELTGARHTLLAARAKRTRPSTDEKTLTSWNAMMLNGYVDAFRATKVQSYLEEALKNVAFLLQGHIKPNGHVFHSLSPTGDAVEGFLEDYAWAARAMINLYEVTFDIRWLDIARKITEEALEEFSNKKGGFFYFSPQNQINPVVRKTEVYDNVIPSSNSVFAEVLFRLGEYFQEARYEQLAREAVTSASTRDPALGVYLANWARVAQMMKYQPFEVAVTGPNAVAEANQLQSNYLPTAFFMGGTEEDLPLLEYKLVKGKTIFYVCRNRVCKQPTEERSVALDQLRLNKSSPPL